MGAVIFILLSSFTGILTWGEGVIVESTQAVEVQDSPMDVRGARRLPISQAMGDKQIEGCCFVLVAFKPF